MERVPAASQKTRKRIAAMIDGEVAQVHKSMLIREAARLIMEEALEGEVTDALGREFYGHGTAAGAGYRNSASDDRSSARVAAGAQQCRPRRSRRLASTVRRKHAAVDPGFALTAATLLSFALAAVSLIRGT